jgi:hypothetical protein
MDKEIGKSVEGDSRTYRNRIRILIDKTQDNKYDCRDSVNEKKDIIFLKHLLHTCGHCNMVVFVEFPHESMHHPFVV